MLSEQVKIVKLISRAIKKFTLLIAWASFHLRLFCAAHIVQDVGARLDWRRTRRRSSAQLKFSARCELKCPPAEWNFTKNFLFIIQQTTTSSHDVQLIVGGRWIALNFTLTLHYSFSFNSSRISTWNRFHEWSSIHTTRRRSESKLFNFPKISSFNVRRELSRVDSRYPNSCRARPRVMIIVQQSKKKSNFIVINGQLSWTPLCLWWTHIESARDRERQTRSCCVSFKIST